jgi:hypothetical protein
MSFSICDKFGEGISLNKLDAEVCKLWGKVSHDKYYCHLPNKSYCWFDSVGLIIHLYKCNTWGEVLQGLCKYYNKELNDLNSHLVLLINYWQYKGYTPLYVI